MTDEKMRLLLMLMYELVQEAIDERMVTTKKEEKKEETVPTETQAEEIEEKLSTARVGDGRLVHYRKTGRFAKFGGGSKVKVPIVEVVDDIDFPWSVEYAPCQIKYVIRMDDKGNYRETEPEEKIMPLRLTGAISYIQNGVIVPNGLKAYPWRGVYHPQSYTKTIYSVKDTSNKQAEALYGTLPEEPDTVTIQKEIEE